MDRWKYFLSFIQVSGSMVFGRAYPDEDIGGAKALNECLN